MSRKKEFKGLLSDSGDTGISQKERILTTHLLSPNSDEVKPINSQQEGAMKDSESTNVPTEAKKIDGPLDIPPVILPADGNKTGDPVSLLDERGTPIPTDDPLYPTGQTVDQIGISTLVSQLKNTDELNVEDTHTRKTYLIDNLLLAKLDEISAGKKKGYKTKVINTGLQIVLDLLRQDNNFKL
ncbi:hypothetical protein EHV15_35590 [Paenibacillus oralis]|uniref:Uncharacterized protein n=1 Tax=Paenibacillus oralis TaxID=2490856 RepID=A0A3P3TA60_9BACL|nr:hypothetical protein [Paenibacillus oralis]RRJ54897.1 hypothetical protein EHV15_35590 [Paenibacillus oralis]